MDDVFAHFFAALLFWLSTSNSMRNEMQKLQVSFWKNRKIDASIHSLLKHFNGEIHNSDYELIVEGETDCGRFNRNNYQRFSVHCEIVFNDGIGNASLIPLSRAPHRELNYRLRNKFQLNFSFLKNVQKYFQSKYYSIIFKSIFTHGSCFVPWNLPSMTKFACQRKRTNPGVELFFRKSQAADKYFFVSRLATATI